MKKIVILGIFISLMFVLALVIPNVVQAQYYNYNYSNYTSHAYRLCVNNTNIYWYDSLNNQQDLYLSCSGGQVCNNQSQYGQCAPYYVNPVLPPIQPPYNPYSTKACVGNSVYWYDSFGVVSGLFKNCVDNNACTIDTCSTSTCSNVIKCDGSTCALGSADYNTHCETTDPNNQNKCGNGLCEPLLGETNANCQADCKINEANALLLSFFAKQNLDSTQWQKTAQIGPDGKIYFMLSLANNSTTSIDNVSISANIPGEISSLGNLQLNGVAISGNIVSGINIGSVAPANTKSITFEGITQTISASGVKQATATSNVLGTTQTDSISIDFVPGQPAPIASVADNPATTGFWEFLKQWYLWILGALILVFLFIIIFKRFSSET